MSQNQTIGKNIKYLRERMGINQNQLAEYLDVTREEVSYFETGSRKMSLQLLSKAAVLFCVEEYDLLDETGELPAANVEVAFRAKDVSGHDLSMVADFQKIVLNYIRMKKKLGDE